MTEADEGQKPVEPAAPQQPAADEAPALTPQELERMTLYAQIMDEVRHRIETYNRIRKAGLYLQAEYEACWLEARMICELIAMACVLAHGEMRKKLTQDFYQADKILDEMQRLKPDFYPKPARVVFKPGLTQVDIIEREKKHITRDELAALWHTAGNKLHAGPLEKYVKVRYKQPAPEMKEVQDWMLKIIGLLNSHVIFISPKKLIHVLLKAEGSGDLCANVISTSAGMVKRVEQVRIPWVRISAGEPGPTVEGAPAKAAPTGDDAAEPGDATAPRRDAALPSPEVTAPRRE